MSAALLIARLVLAAVFAVAGVAKLADLQGSRRAVAAFGVPTGLAGVVGVALPLAELAVAVLLLPEATAWWGALGALLLLLLFCAAIGVSLARGRHARLPLLRPAALRARRTVSTLLRNGALAAVAAFVLVAGVDDAGPGALEWIGDLEGSELIALVAGVVGRLGVAACAALALRLLRAHGRLLLRLDALEQRLPHGRHRPARRPAPTSSRSRRWPASPPRRSRCRRSTGRRWRSDDLLAAGRPALLVFSHPGCGPCRELAPELAEWQHDVRRRPRGRRRHRRQRGGRARGARRGAAGPRAARGATEEVAVSVEYEVGGTPGAVLVGRGRHRRRRPG